MADDDLTIVRRVLAAAGVDDDGLRARHGWSNRAWVGERFVVRVSSGRLAGSLAHEAEVVTALDDTEVPVAPVVAQGTVADLFDVGLSQPDGAKPPGEWLVSRRLPGETLAVVWPRLAPRERAAVGEHLGTCLAGLHATAIAVDPPAWWTEAHQPGHFHNAYRPSVSLGPALVAAAAELPGADGALVDDVAALIDERLVHFAADRHVFVHGDVHGHNLLVADSPEGYAVTGLLDWEGAHQAAPDLELDMLLRYVAHADAFPSHPDGTATIERGDLVELVGHVGSAYPDLFAAPHLRERLEVYEVHWQLVQLLLHFVGTEGDADAGGREPPENWGQLADVLRGRSHLARFTL